MSGPEMLKHLLKGLNQDVYWRMAPLIRDQIDDTDKFLSAVNRFEIIEHRSLSKSRYTEIPDQVPSRRKREDIDSFGSELIMMKGLQFKVEDLKLEQYQMKRRSLVRPNLHATDIITGTEIPTQWIIRKTPTITMKNRVDHPVGLNPDQTTWQ